MTLEEICESGFFEAFCGCYIDDREYDFKDKDIASYSISENVHEKKKYTEKALNKTKKKILKLGFDDIVSSYFRQYPDGFNPEYSTSAFWISKINQVILGEYESIQPVCDFAIKYLVLEGVVIKAKTIKKYEKEVRERISFKLDKNKGLWRIILNEGSVCSLIEDCIKGYQEEEDWDIDIYYFKNCKKDNLVLNRLLDLCELMYLFVRYEMLNYFREIENSEIDKEKGSFQSEYSVFEWATIFYYVNETNLLLIKETVKVRMESFMKENDIETTFGNFKTKYYQAKKRINVKNDYPIEKLEKILLFLKENYEQTVNMVKNDIVFLKSESSDF